MIRSLGARLVAAALVFLTLALFSIWIFLTHLFEKQVASERVRELQAIADTLAAGLQAENGKLVLKTELRDPRFAIPAGGRYWQIDGIASGIVRSRSMWDSEMVPAKTNIAGSRLGVIAGPGGDEMLVLVQEVQIEDGSNTLAATLRSGADKAEFDQAVSDFNSELLIMLAFTGLFLGLASGLQIFVGLKPLGQVRREISALRRGETDAIDMKGPAEVLPLILEINTLMADGRAAVERARARASDLAHGLKTPLTILGQIGESLVRKGNVVDAQQIDDQVSTIRSRVDRQLALARAGTPAREAGIEVSNALDRLMKAAGPLASHNGIAVEVSGANSMIIRTDMTDFLEATGNVLDNAIRHASDKVAICATRNARTVTIEISDNGLGIGETDRDRVLERGISLDESGDGSGLGLAISADILRAYGGSISLSQSAMGGLAVRMEWPSAGAKEEK